MKHLLSKISLFLILSFLFTLVGCNWKNHPVPPSPPIGFVAVSGRTSGVYFPISDCEHLGIRQNENGEFIREGMYISLRLAGMNVLSESEVALGVMMGFCGATQQMRKL